MHILMAYGYHAGTTGEYLERALRREHMVTYVGATDGSRPGYPLDTDVERIYARLDPRPDLYLWVDCGRVFSFPRGVERLPIPTVGYLIDVNLGSRLRGPLSRFFDHVFVAQKDFMTLYHRPNAPCHWLPLAFDPETMRPLALPEQFDIGFVGATGGFYTRRTEALRLLEGRFRLNDYRHPYPPDKMVEVYARSRLVFNCTHRGELNMRVFEVLGCRKLLLTDRSRNGLLDLFVDGEHLVTWGSHDELLDRAAYYLADEPARTRIAEAGYAHALDHHTYLHRGRRIVAHVTSDAARGASAPARQWSDARLTAEYAGIYSMLRALDPTFSQFLAARREGRLGGREALALGKAVMRRLRYG